MEEEKRLRGQTVFVEQGIKVRAVKNIPTNKKVSLTSGFFCVLCFVFSTLSCRALQSFDKKPRRFAQENVVFFQCARRYPFGITHSGGINQGAIQHSCALDSERGGCKHKFDSHIIPHQE